METIVVSREIKFDRKSQPEVLRDLERLKEAGFSVFRKEEQQAPVAEVKAKPKTDEANDIRRVVESIRERHGISLDRIGALVGVTGGAVANWASGRRSASAESWRLLSRLKRRSDSLPPRSETLIAEASGALKGRRLVKGRGWQHRRTSEDDRLQMAILRFDEGVGIEEIAEKFSVSAGTVYRVIRDFETKKEEV
jgi:transposase